MWRFSILIWTTQRLALKEIIGQWLKLGLLLRRTDLDDEQTETVFGGFQSKGCS